MPAGLHLQPRDIRFLAELGDLGLFDTDTAHLRHFADVSRRRCQQKLRQYQEKGLTKTANLCVWFAEETGGRVPAIHLLTERGAAAVAAALGERPQRIARSDIAPETFYHRLEIVKARLAIDDAFAALGLPRPNWIMEQDRRSDVRPSRPPSQQRVLYHAFTVGENPLTCQPDAASRMQIPRDAASPDSGFSELVGFWEIDRSTEGHRQIKRKLPGYAALLAERAYQRYWPDVTKATVRVFWVCRSQQRVEALGERLRNEPVAQLFRFTTAEALSATTALTAPIWHATSGAPRAILRLPAAANLSTNPH